MAATSDLPYKTAPALWAGVGARARTEAKALGVNPGDIVDEFVFGRFLARIFADPEAPWVLKGGMAMLARVRDARATRDIDLLRSPGELEAAIEALEHDAARGLGDHFRFQRATRRGSGGLTQPDVEGVRITFDAYCGVKKVRTVSVDLVVGSTMTAPPWTARAATRLPIGEPPTVRLYPVVDHIADKLCAMHALYRGMPSSRERDLIDLLIFAQTEPVDATALKTAVDAEWTSRDLEGPPRFEPPTEWAKNFSKQAAASPRTAGWTFDDAVACVRAFLSPATGDGPHDGRWDPGYAIWHQA